MAGEELAQSLFDKLLRDLDNSNLSGTSTITVAAASVTSVAIVSILVDNSNLVGVTAAATKVAVRAVWQ